MPAAGNARIQPHPAMSPAASPRRNRRGLTLIELMVALAVAAILAAIALPSYSAYIRKSKARTAASDLVAMGLAMENRFQKTLLYPVYSSATTVAATPSSRSGTVATDFSTWAPAQGDSFTYSVVSTTSSYTLTATGISGTIDCTLTLTSGNVRSVSGTQCGFSSW